METYKTEFIEFLVRSSVVTFGDFVTKSGRRTPYFINSGRFKTGPQIQALGQFYAHAINQHFGTKPGVLFGPAYKGIPLVVTTSIALSNMQKRPICYCFNRKEAKDHGEGGVIVGHTLQNGDSVIIVEDVITAGTSIREVVPLLKKQADIVIAGVVVSVDRMEKGDAGLSAIRQIREEFGFPVAAIATIEEIVTWLHNRPVDGSVYIDDARRKSIDEYRKLYGAD